MYKFRNSLSSNWRFRVGYNGTHCETVIDACQYEPSICLNGGKCELDDKQLHGFVCYCKNVGRLLISGIYVRVLLSNCCCCVQYM